MSGSNEITGVHQASARATCGICNENKLLTSLFIDSRLPPESNLCYDCLRNSKGMKYKIGTRVKIGGDLHSWTPTAQKHLPGVTGEVIGFDPFYCDLYPANLVKLDRPVMVHSLLAVCQVWINCDNLFVETT